MKKFIKENWFKVSIFIAVLIIALSAAYYFVIFLPNHQQQKTLTTNSDIDSQAKCADAAKKFFYEDKWGRAAENINSNNINYSNHFSSKYNQCFILIAERFSDGSGTSEILYDILGHKEYANGTFGKNGLGAPSNYCEILSGECKSNSDFNQFVSEYMEN